MSQLPQCPNCFTVAEEAGDNFCYMCGADLRPFLRAFWGHMRWYDKLGCAFVLTVLVVAGFLFSQRAWAMVNGPSSNPARIEQEVLAMVNTQREKESLRLLTFDPALQEIARQRCQDMLQRGYVGHYDPTTGEGLLEPLLQQYGFSARTATEVLVGTFVDDSRMPDGDLRPVSPHHAAASIVNGLLESPGHREAVLNPEFSLSGVGVSFSEDGKAYIAIQVLAGR